MARRRRCNDHAERLLRKNLADGFSDGLTPLLPIDVGRTRSVDEILEAYRHCSFGARNLGDAADVLTEMVTDPDCFVVVTLSGAMTVAKMGLVLCEMIDRGWVQAIVSTGALMAHGFVEASGRHHFRAMPGASDVDLYAKGYDRVYDTYELEKNLDEAEEIVVEVLTRLPRSRPVGSREIHAALGQYLAKNVKGRAILKSAHRKKVPVYVPAFTDSELGLDFALFNRGAAMKGERPLVFDAFLDLEHFTETIARQKRIGIFTIGGGVPRNWAQQVGPYLEIIGKRLGVTMPVLRYTYGVRICPEPVHYGGLSGCTYSEGISWGKFVPPEEGGRFAEVLCDATIAWPILVRAVIERLDGRRRAARARRRG